MSDKFEPVGTLFSAVEKLIFEPSWRRFFHLVLSVGVLLGAFMVFEWYTRTFELARLERSIDVLRKLHALKAETGETNEQEIVRMGGALERQMNRLVPPQTPYAAETKEGQVTGAAPLWKFLFALIPWILIIAATARSQAKKGGNALNTFMGGMVVSFVFAALATLVPTWHWPWFNLAIFPFLQFLVIIVIAIIVALMTQASKKKPS